MKWRVWKMRVKYRGSLCTKYEEELPGRKGGGCEKVNGGEFERGWGALESDLDLGSPAAGMPAVSGCPDETHLYARGFRDG